MLTVMCMKWSGKSVSSVSYGPRHVNTLKRMLERHLHMDYEFVCITDDPSGLECRTIPMWEDNSPGCYRRLDLFHPRMEKILGKRFVSVDLDVVILDDVTPIFSRQEDFVIWQHPIHHDRYCGSMFMMNAGSREEVYHAPRENNTKFAGTDQIVIRETLGPNEAVWTREDGIYTRLRLPMPKPPNSRMIFYPGKRDPSTDNLGWVKEHWR